MKQPEERMADALEKIAAAVTEMHGWLAEDRRRSQAFAERPLSGLRDLEIAKLDEELAAIGDEADETKDTESKGA